MKLNKFMEIHGAKMRHLETIFLRNVFYKDFGEKGLDLIEPETSINRNDGSGRKWRIDFVIKTKFAKYAVECDGFNYHAPGRVSRERDNELHEKRNETIRQGYIYIELTRDQIEVTPEDAIYQLRRSFIADEQLYGIFLRRNKGTIQPSEVQEIVLDKLNITRKDGEDKGLVVLATGLGKTFLSIFDSLQIKAKKICFIVHDFTILRKTRNSFEKLMPDRVNEMGFLGQGNLDKNKNIIFSTIQTLTKDKHLNSFKNNHFDYIILDESHHLAAPTYKKVFNYFKPKFFLGLTATPDRTDQQDILNFYNDNLVFQMDQEEAVKKGFLTNINYLGFLDDVDYTNIFFNGFRYDVNDLNKALMIEKRDKAIISKYKELASGKKSIGFCSSIEHANWCSKVFNDAGIKSVAIHSKLDNPDIEIDERDRDKLVDDFEKGKYQVAFTVNMFNEGVDFPEVECLLLLRPTESVTILTQQIGRGLRISPGKKGILILDFIGNYQTAHKILPALGINGPGELIHDSEKDIYYFDNNGRKVIFESEVVKIFRIMTSRATKRVRTEVLNEEWKNYGEYVHENTKEGVKLIWKLGNKNRHMDVQLWGLNLIKDKLKTGSFEELSQILRKESKKKFPSKTLEGVRALFLSKLFGFLKGSRPMELSDAFKSINNENIEDVLTNQLEKFYFWNNLFSLTNRHVDASKRQPINVYFHIYPLFFIYEVLTILKEKYGYENLSLTKFEINNFLILAKKHTEIKEVVERIVSYREDDEKLEIEKLLKEKNGADARFFNVLMYNKYFNWSKNKISIKEEYFEEVLKKVDKFNQLIGKGKLIEFKEDNPREYLKMLYSDDDLLTYHNKL
jgi:superfamily II DNA or RNA helicase